MRACVNGTTTLLSRAMNIAAIPILKAQLMGLVQAISQAATEDSMGNMLSSEQWDLLLPYLRPMELPVGQVLFAQGTTERTLYLVESGSLTVHYEDEQQRVRLAIVGPGSVVGIMLRNSPDAVLLMLATVKCGAVAGMINYNQRGNVLAHSLGLLGAKVLVTESDFHEPVLECGAAAELTTGLMSVEELRELAVGQSTAMPSFAFASKSR